MKRRVLDVVEVGVLLERGDRAPEKRQRRDERRADRGGVEAHPSGRVPAPGAGPQAGDMRAVHQNVSILRTARRIAMAAASSSGKRNSAIAAPCARSPPSMPLKYA